MGVRRVFSMNRPETHEILRDWRRLADGYEPPRVLVGEAYVLDTAAWARFYGSGSDELNLAFNFALVHADLDAEEMRAIVGATEAALPAGAWPCWIGSNHDAGRLATRWCHGDESLARCALLLLMTLRGTPSLYYGDELALPEGHVPQTRTRCRRPVAGPQPHPDAVGATRRLDRSVAPARGHAPQRRGQRSDPASTLHYTRDLIALRRRLPDLRAGRYSELPAPAGAWAYRRGGNVVVAMNLGTESAEIDGIDGTIALASVRARENERVSGRLQLGPAQGVLVMRQPQPTPH